MRQEASGHQSGTQRAVIEDWAFQGHWRDGIETTGGFKEVVAAIFEDIGGRERPPAAPRPSGDVAIHQIVASGGGLEESGIRVDPR